VPQGEPETFAKQPPVWANIIRKRGRKVDSPKIPVPQKPTQPAAPSAESSKAEKPASSDSNFDAMRKARERAKRRTGDES
jgi:hypothetical protein